jgi:heterodisulfide reductase subunit A-like polyferredoxin
MSGGVLVLGGDIQGVQTALDLADCGLKVTLVEPSPSLTGDGSDSPERLRLIPRMLKAVTHPNIRVLTGATVSQVTGSPGNLQATVVQQPRYVDTTICTSCGRCQEQCPVHIFRPDAAVEGRKAISRPDYGLKSVPSAYVVEKKGVPPCTAACPAGVNGQGYVALISQGKFAEALELITDSVAFPRVLGRVCTHPCEKECTRGKIDQPVAICALKRFVSNGSTPLPQPEVSPAAGRPRVAIIGSGPAGLTAARDLARMGHRVTVFEALPVPGGMITVGMPRFRLPREVRQADIDDILRIGGIEIKTNTPIGKDLTINDLKRQGYAAILIAVGAHKNQKLGILGEGLSGVINSIALLQALNLKQLIIVGKKVVVVGGGYTGIDSARTAIRLHCDRVLVMDRCAKEDLPANPEELVEAEEEGVQFEYLVTPVKIIGQDNKVVGVQCRRMKLGERDKSGRRPVTPIDGSDFFIEADTVIVAAGQRPDLSFLEGDTTLTDGKKHINVEPVTMATKVPGIFAAGDAAADPSPIINAIAAGRRAAVSIDRFLRGESLSEGRCLTRVKPVEVNLAEVTVPLIERQPMPCLPYEDRIGNFEEVDLGFTAEMAAREAQRCLNCAVCSNCRQCERACELNAIDHDMTARQWQLEVGAIVVSNGRQDKSVSLPSPSAELSSPGIYTIPSTSNGDLSPASAVASRVVTDLMKHHPLVREDVIVREPIKTNVLKLGERSTGERQVGNQETRAGVFICRCGGNISDVIDVSRVVAECRQWDGIVMSQPVGYACTPEAAQEIKELARQHGLTHVVVAACACCNLDQICFSCADRRVQCKSNLLNSNGQTNIYYEFVNIREHCAWAHASQPETATAKAASIIRAGLARAILSQPLTPRALDIERKVLVVGRGVAGVQAATDLATQGFPTIVIPHSERRNQAQNLIGELSSSGAIVLNQARLINIASAPGKYQATLVQGGKARHLTVGAVICDLTSWNGHKTRKDTELSLFLNTARSGNKLLVTASRESVLTRLPGVFICGIGPSAKNAVEAQRQGSAAAAKASAWLRQQGVTVSQTAVSIDQQRCRGCGTCQSICEFGAVAVTERAPGIFSAVLNEGLCRGCGVCVAHCPSGALSQNGCSDRQITASLAAVLSQV